MILSDMARQGKVDYQIVRTLGLAFDVVLRDTEFRLRYGMPPHDALTDP